MGGVSAAGFRPGFGFGGSIHCFLTEIVGGLPEPGIGARGLLIVDGAAGVSTGGEGLDD